MSSLTIFVLCHNRPDFARETLHSILKQTDHDFNLVVSDNSSNNEVETMVRSDFPQLEYRRRNQMRQSLEHFNLCMDEAESDYFCLFHDDDIMQPNFVRCMRQVLDENQQAIACGCNALLESHGIIQRRAMFRALGRLEWIASPRSLARRYFARAQSGIAPFPGYVYRRSMVGKLRLDADGGKHSDVSWLMNVVMKGRIVWIAEPLMIYRVHSNNDSGTESLRDQLRFMGYMKQNIELIGRDVLTDFRRSRIYKPISNNVFSSPRRKEAAKVFLKRYNRLRYTNIHTYSALIHHALVKVMTK